MNNRGWTLRSIVLLSVLPFVHLCACVTILISRSVEFMLIADFPASGLFLGLAWRFGHPFLWFATLGTAWWYLLSWMLREIVRITTDPGY